MSCAASGICATAIKETGGSQTAGWQAADGYRSRVRLCEFGVLFVLKARLTTKAVIDTNTSMAAVETAAAIIASV